jgi:hypothetical protein
MRKDPGAGAPARMAAPSCCHLRAVPQLPAMQPRRRHPRLADCAALARLPCPSTGLFPEAWVARLQHLCDAVVSLETLADDSDVYRLVPDQTR